MAKIVILYSSTGISIQVKANTEEELRKRIFEAAQNLRSAIDF